VNCECIATRFKWVLSWA